MRLLDLFENDIFLENQKAQRAQWIRDKLGDDFQRQAIPGYAKKEDGLQRLIDKLSAVDPTNNGAYMPWLARMVIKDPHKNKPEDLERMGDDLANFERLKPRLAKRDINQYKSFEEVYDTIEPLLKAAPSEKDIEKEKERQRDAEMRGQIINVYEGPEGWIKSPTTEKASCWLGRNTRWCNAAEKNNQFNYYNKSDRLFVIFDKKSGERMQLHIDSGQLADEADRMKGMHNVPEWAKQPILDWYLANVGKDKLTLKQVLTLGSTFGGEDLAKGTEHEDLLDLFKQYKV